MVTLEAHDHGKLPQCIWMGLHRKDCPSQARHPFRLLEVGIGGLFTPGPTARQVAQNRALCPGMGTASGVIGSPHQWILVGDWDRTGLDEEECAGWRDASALMTGDPWFRYTA